MASQLNDEDQSLLGPDTGTSATAPSTSTSSGSSAAASPVANAPNNSINPQPSSAADVNNIVSLNQGVDFSPLISSLQGEGTTAKGDLTSAQNNFTTALGSTPTFGTDQQNTLSDVLKGNQPLATGQGLLNTQYTGPTGLDQTKFNTDFGKFTGDVNQTGSPESLSGLLTSRDPTLTPGDARFDALVYGGNPDFKTAASGLQNQANDLGASGTQAATDATNAIGQRKTDIGAFNTAGTGYVKSQVDNINNLIGQQETANTNSDNSLQALLAALKAGTTTNLNAAPAGSLKFDPSTVAPVEFASAFGRPVFDQTVNPSGFINYAAGDTPTRDNSATTDQGTQFNNAMQLLNLVDRLNPTARNAASLGLDQNALTAALQAAYGGLNSADAAEAARRNRAFDPSTQNIFGIGQALGNAPNSEGGGGHSDTSAPGGGTGSSSGNAPSVGGNSTPGSLGGQVAGETPGAPNSAGIGGTIGGIAGALGGIGPVGSTIGATIGAMNDISNAVGTSVPASDIAGIAAHNNPIAGLLGMLGVSVGIPNSDEEADINSAQANPNNANANPNSMSAQAPDVTQNAVNAAIAAMAEQNTDTVSSAPVTGVDTEGLSAPDAAPSSTVSSTAADQAAADAAAAAGSGDTSGDSGSGGGSGGAAGGSGPGGGAGDGGGGDGPGCFVGSTPILMADGTTKSILNIEVGDDVAAFDGLGEMQSRKVSAVMVPRVVPVIYFGGNTMHRGDIYCTAAHPFLLSDGTWKEAGALVPGDTLVTADGSPHPVKWAPEKAGTYMVHNFTVDDLHTYVAGGLRVHNKYFKGGLVAPRALGVPALGERSKGSPNTKTSGYYGGGQVHPLAEALNRFNGGDIPNFEPAGRDVVPTYTTKNEFVESAPAVKALGVDAFSKLNQADTMQPDKLNALKEALKRAA